MLVIFAIPPPINFRGRYSASWWPLRAHTTNLIEKERWC